MAQHSPFGQLIGPLKIYVAPFGTTAEAEPDVDTTPAGNWVELGETDGDQVIQHTGTMTYFSDNNHTEDITGVRGAEGVTVKATLVNLTLEMRTRILGMAVGAVTSDAGPPAVKQLRHKRGFYPQPYSLLLRGPVDSPYGQFPGQRYIPKGLMDGEPEETRSKAGRAGLAFEFHALGDDNQADGDELGWLTVQTA
jgi:hypothetical protein